MSRLSSAAGADIERPRSGGLANLPRAGSRSRRAGTVASAAGGWDGADADHFMQHLEKGLQEFDESAL